MRGTFTLVTKTKTSLQKNEIKSYLHSDPCSGVRYRSRPALVTQHSLVLKHFIYRFLPAPAPLLSDSRGRSVNRYLSVSLSVICVLRCKAVGSFSNLLRRGNHKVGLFLHGTLSACPIYPVACFWTTRGKRSTRSKLQNPHRKYLDRPQGSNPGLPLPMLVLVLSFIVSEDSGFKTTYLFGLLHDL